MEKSEANYISITMILLNRICKAGIVFLLLACRAFAQPAFDFQAIRDKHPDKDYFMLSKSQQLILELEKDRLTMKNRESSDLLYLSERSTRASEKSVPRMSAFSKLNKIDARTWVPSGSGKMKALPVEKYMTRKPVQEGIFFDDGEESYFYYPGLIQGAVASLNYEEEWTDPHLLGTYVFQSGVPVRESVFSVVFPETVKVNYRILNDKANQIVFKEERKKGKVIYTFSARDLKEIQFEEMAPDFRYYAPHVILFVEEYELNGKRSKVLPDLKGLFQWYNGLVEQVKNDASDELKALADSIKLKHSAPEDQLKAAVYWQQEYVKYIAFEDGLGGFIPRNPSDVLRKRYGDCKDKTYLLSLLLRQMGFEAYPAWIGTRDIPYRYADVFTPAVDNHMITALRWKNQWLFVDGTSRFLPMDMPTSMIQGKEAMIRLDKDSFLIVQVPEMAMERNVRADDFKMELSGRDLKGYASRTFMGYFQQSQQMNLDFQSPAKRDEAVLKGLSIANNKYTAKNLSYSGYGNRDSALTIRYDLELKDYVQEIDDKLYLNLNLLKVMPMSKTDWSKRENGISFDFKYISQFDIEVKLPEGYSVTSLPNPVRDAGSDYSLEMICSTEGDRLHLRHTYRINTLMIPAEGLPDWSVFYDKLLSSYKSVVILKKN
jgi:hypothetical protein